MASTGALPDTRGMRPSKPTDLFPWILGGLLIAVAIPAAVTLLGERPEAVTVAATSLSPSMPVPKALDVPVPRVNEAPRVGVAPAKIQSSQRIWQCTSNGQKTFSDSPCGSDASVHTLSQVNRMDAFPLSHTAGYPSYRGPTYDSATPDENEPGEDASPLSGPTVVVGVLNRREERHRRHEHEHAAHTPPAVPRPTLGSPRNSLK